MTSSVPSIVRNFLDRFPAPQTGIVAVSGGPDSVALLRALREVDPGPLIVAHVNHALRGRESDDDERFVQVLACELGLEFCSTQISIPSGENFESGARKRRYAWLERVANEHQAGWIATGHTADDQAETLLHRLTRGTGIQGLRGIAAQRGRIVRPILEIARADLLSYLQQLNQAYRIDSSNADRRYTRNRIRHELVPRLREFNPEIVSILGRLAEQSGEIFELIELQAMELLRRAERARAGPRIILDRSELVASPKLLVREALRIVWRREQWPMDAMTFDHWKRAAEFVEGNYPNGVVMRNVGLVVQLLRQS